MKKFTKVEFEFIEKFTKIKKILLRQSNFLLLKNDGIWTFSKSNQNLVIYFATLLTKITTSCKTAKNLNLVMLIVAYLKTIYKIKTLSF